MHDRVVPVPPRRIDHAGPLRLDRVRVLDFVSDVRRVAATLELQRAYQAAAAGEIEHVTLPHATFSFSSPEIGTLLQEWIKDAAALEDAADEVRLQFPEGFVPT